MPDWIRPQDIHFDHAAAEAALDAIAAARFTLEWAWSAEGHTAGLALARWEGLAADSYRASHRARRSATGEASERLRLLAAAIQDAIDDAVAAQRRVDTLQVEWDAQWRSEQQAAADAAAAIDAEAANDATPVGRVPAGLS